MSTATLAAVSFDAAGPVMVWVVVLSFVFVECALVVGMFLPGDTLLLAAGLVLADGDHHLNAWLLSLVATVFAVAGNQVGYVVGRYAGTRLLARRNGRILNRARLERATAFFDRWGFWAIVVARWVPWVRTLAPMIAGAGRMDSRRYLVANAVGAVIWIPTLIMLGYYGAGLLDAVPWLRDAFVIAGVAFMVVGTGYGVYRYRQEMRRPVDDASGDDTAADEPAQLPERR